MATIKITESDETIGLDETDEIVEVVDPSGYDQSDIEGIVQDMNIDGNE